MPILDQALKNGEFFRVIADVIQGSKAHADLVSLCEQASKLKAAVEAYMDEHDGDLAEVLLNKVTSRITPRQQEQYLDQTLEEIRDWDGNTYGDVRGFIWSLNAVVSMIESQLYVAPRGSRVRNRHGVGSGSPGVVRSMIPCARQWPALVHRVRLPGGLLAGQPVIDS